MATKVKKEIVKTSPDFERVLKVTETTKESRLGFAENLIERITEGQISALDVHLKVKVMEDVFKQVSDNPEYRRLLLEESKKAIGEESKYSYHNATFSIGETGTKYDFSKCNDPKMNELLIEEKELKSKMEKRGKFLKTVPEKGMDILVVDEIIKIFPPSKTSTTSVITKLL